MQAAAAGRSVVDVAAASAVAGVADAVKGVLAAVADGTVFAAAFVAVAVVVAAFVDVAVVAVALTAVAVSAAVASSGTAPGRYAAPAVAFVPVVAFVAAAVAAVATGFARGVAALHAVFWCAEVFGEFLDPVALAAAAAVQQIPQKDC